MTVQPARYDRSTAEATFLKLRKKYDDAVRGSHPTDAELAVLTPQQLDELRDLEWALGAHNNLCRVGPRPADWCPFKRPERGESPVVRIGSPVVQYDDTLFASLFPSISAPKQNAK